MFLEDYQLEQTLNILNNKSKWKPALLNDLAEWAENELDLTVINYFLDTLSDNRPRIIILVWDDEERNRFFDKIHNYDKAKQKLVREKFAQLAKKHNVYPVYQKPDEVFVCIDTLKDELERITLSKATPKITAKTGGIIHKIIIGGNTIHIFFETENQLKESKENGYCDKIQKKLTKILKKYDKYKLYSNGAPCVFTSKQMLDEKYDGNMYYYLL